MSHRSYRVIVIGGGHAGVEAAWAAANLLAGHVGDATGRVALVTMDASKIGVMSCNPANGGLAKGQLVREIDAMGGVMGLATDATGIQFKMLNTSKGPAVWGPRAQCDKHAYARRVQAMIASRPEIEVVEGLVEDLLIEADGRDANGTPRRRIVGVVACAAPEPRPPGDERDSPRPLRTRIGEATTLRAEAVVLTTGTFMRALMHTGEAKATGGRHDEGAAVGIAHALAGLGFELGRLKTGTPPRIDRSSIDWEDLPEQLGDAEPCPFSDLSCGLGPIGGHGPGVGDTRAPRPAPPAGSIPGVTPAVRDADPFPSLARFPVMPQIACRVTSTTPRGHEAIRANLHRAPMFSGQITSQGPRYCPSIEDKVVRFAQRDAHTVFLEPESLGTDWIYCNGIATSLPLDVQEAVVRAMPGCGRARILRAGYAVEYDMVRPHQIHATCMTKAIGGLFLAGQINGTSGYEEAAAQGLVAGINAARLALDLEPWLPGRADSYVGVLMDDLVTKTPVEPYRMFTSRAEHRLLLRADNSADRLTPIAKELGLLEGHGLGVARWRTHTSRRAAIEAAGVAIGAARIEGEPLARRMLRPEFGVDDLARALGPALFQRSVLQTVLADRQYAGFIDRQRAEIRRQAGMESRRLPASLDYTGVPGLRNEAKAALGRFRPETFGQAARLEGITPADITILAVHARKIAPGH